MLVKLVVFVKYLSFGPLRWSANFKPQFGLNLHSLFWGTGIPWHFAVGPKMKLALVALVALALAGEGKQSPSAYFPAHKMPLGHSFQLLGSPAGCAAKPTLTWAGPAMKSDIGLPSLQSTLCPQLKRLQRVLLLEVLPQRPKAAAENRASFLAQKESCEIHNVPCQMKCESSRSVCNAANVVDSCWGQLGKGKGHYCLPSGPRFKLGESFGWLAECFCDGEDNCNEGY